MQVLILFIFIYLFAFVYLFICLFVYIDIYFLHFQFSGMNSRSFLEKRKKNVLFVGGLFVQLAILILSLSKHLMARKVSTFLKHEVT